MLQMGTKCQIHSTSACHPKVGTGFGKNDTHKQSDSATKLFQRFVTSARNAAMTNAPTAIAIICGNGAMPTEVASHLRATGREPLLIGLIGEAAPAIETFPHEYLAFGQIGKLYRLLESRGIKTVVFAGGIARRPELLEMKLDLGALLTLPRVLGALLGGDNSVFDEVIAIFEQRGIKVVGAHEVAPGLLAGEGKLAGRAPSKRNIGNLRAAHRASKLIGSLDIGQACIAISGRIIAVEAAEGTDLLLARAKELREQGMISYRRNDGVLVKTMKPGQDPRIDLPTIGPNTILAVAEAGLAGIGIEAQRSIIIDRKMTLALASKKGVFVYGLAIDFWDGQDRVDG